MMTGSFQIGIDAMDKMVKQEQNIKREAYGSSYSALDKAKQSKTEVDDIFDTMFSTITMAQTPFFIKIKSKVKESSQIQLTYPALFQEHETGKLYFKLVIENEDRGNIIYETQYSQALTSLLHYIMKQMGSDSWENILKFARRLVTLNEEPLWKCLMVDCLYTLYSVHGFTKLILAVELNEDHHLDNWIGNYLQTFKEFTTTDICAANTTALISAASIKSDGGDSLKDIICQLVDIGKASLNKTNDDLCTPLMFASLHNNVKAMEFLIKSGALIDLRDTTGRTALYIATESDHPEAVACLLLHKANTEHTSLDTEFTPLLAAIYAGNPAIVRLLLDAGANPNVMANPNKTALMLAINHYAIASNAGALRDENEVEKAEQSIVYLLNDNRTDHVKTNTKGATALSLARIHELEVIVKLLNERKQTIPR